MPGIALTNLGAVPGIPSPAAGIPAPNPLVQLGQEAAQIPAEVNAYKQNADKTALMNQQVEDSKRKVVQDRYDRNLQLVKNNPMLKGNQAIVGAIDSDAKTLGIVPPIIDASSQQNVAGSSATAIPASSSAAQPAGGSPPAGQAPAQEGGMGAPLNAPTAAPGAALNPGDPSGGAGGYAPGVGPQAAGGRQIDMEAISPHPGFSSFATPQNIKEAASLSPEQRRAAFPPSMFAPNDQPSESFYTMPKTWGPDDTSKAAQARMIVQQTIKNGDPKSIVAAVDAIAPMYKDDPNYDISKLIDPSAWQNVNKIQRDRLDIMKRAGVISEKSLDLRTRKVDSDISMAQTRQGLMQYTTEQKRIQNTYLPQEIQTRIDNMQSEMRSRSKNADTAAQRLTQTIQQNGILNASREKGDVIKERGQINQSIGSMQNQVRAMVAAGQDQTAATDDDGTPTTMGAKLAKQIIAAQGQRDKLDQVLKIANDPTTAQKAVTSKLPGATDSKPANLPQGAQVGTLHTPDGDKPGYQLNGKMYLMNGTPVN
jgi:hypothetical protein